MVKIVKLPPREQPKPEYTGPNPYDPVTVVIGGIETVARPTAFDSDPVDNGIMNAFGGVIQATEYSTSCPNCGHGMLVRNAGGYLIGLCDNCNAETPPPPPIISPEVRKAIERIVRDPFCNPIIEGRLALSELDGAAAAVDLMSSLVNSNQTVAAKAPAKPVDILDNVVNMGEEEEDD